MHTPYIVHFLWVGADNDMTASLTLIRWRDFTDSNKVWGDCIGWAWLNQVKSLQRGNGLSLMRESLADVEEVSCHPVKIPHAYKVKMDLRSWEWENNLHLKTSRKTDLSHSHKEMNWTLPIIWGRLQDVFSQVKPLVGPQTYLTPWFQPCETLSKRSS